MADFEKLAGMVDREDEEDEDEDEEEDDDYRPSDASDPEMSEGEAEDDPTVDPAATSARSKGKKKQSSKASTKKSSKATSSKATQGGRKRGGICLSDDEAEAGGGSEATAEAAGGPSETAAEAPAKKQKVDDIWASMKSETTTAKKSKIDDIWAELKGGSGGGKSAAPKKYTVTEEMDFAGEKISVKKTLEVGSKEEKEYLKRKAKAAAAAAATTSNQASAISSTTSTSTSSSSRAGSLGAALASASAARLGSEKDTSSSSSSSSSSGGVLGKLGIVTLGAPKLGDSSMGFLKKDKPSAAEKPKTGLDALLANINKGSAKISTLDKSRMDWSSFKDKQSDQVKDELEKFKKDGYLEKQAFLARSDARQAEIARDARRKRMGVKGE